MNRIYAELGFDLLIALATVLGIGMYMLGVFLDPSIAAGMGIALVLLGVIGLIPSGERVPASAIGITAVVLAGVLVPRVVATADPGGDELAVTLLGSGFVLLFTFALVRVTTFRRRNRRVS